MKNELIECPFCGSYDIIIHENVYLSVRPDDYQVECQKCLVTTDTYSTIQEATTRWNTRYNERKVPK